MRHLRILNSREVKHIHDELEKQFGFTGKLDRAFLKSNKGKIYGVTSEIAKVPYDDFRIDSMGIYLMTDKDGDIRLSIEGSQLVGPSATKNIVELDSEQLDKWFRGEDIEFGESRPGFQMVRSGSDFIGCGKLVNGILKNYMPKSRRIMSEL